MILIIAIIINIIMIAIVTVNVVITGIIMKTCLFLLLLFSYVIIINDVTVFGFVLPLNQSDSTRTLAFVSVSDLFLLVNQSSTRTGRRSCHLPGQNLFFSFPLQRIKLFFSSAER